LFVAPPRVEELAMVNETSKGFAISWRPPEYANETNVIRNYTVTVDKLVFPKNDIGTAIHKPKTLFQGILAGNVTSVEIQKFKNSTFKDKIRISIAANSSGGGSAENMFTFILKGKWKINMLNCTTKSESIIARDAGNICQMQFLRYSEYDGICTHIMSELNTIWILLLDDKLW